MRIALLYPPPWKIAPRGEPPERGVDGPPDEYSEGDLDPDFYQTPYGLFSLGAQAIRAGHQVKILNLSAYPWAEVEAVLKSLSADVYGMSCWTANRRGVALAAKCIRAQHPDAHIIVGGPHATPLAVEMLHHVPEIDTIALGESEPAFLELLDRLGAHAPTTGIAGTAYRAEEGILLGPHRDSIADLDTLASPQDYFDTHILMTSRGCPWACTFCGAETTWGRGFRGQSVSYVLDAMDKVVSRLPVKMIQIKDDTFTTNKKRVMELCRGIRERKLSFFWSCDTRVDLLTEPLLREMRLAGCERLSLGVESGSQTILDKIDKKITVDEILESTELAKKVGIRVRYYMMLGNRGETADDYRAILERLGDYHAAHMDLAGALIRDGQVEEGEHHVRRALELGYPLPGLAYNYLAFTAYGRGDLDGMMNHFTHAAKVDPQHYVLIQNVNRARAWFKNDGPKKRLPLALTARHDFQLLERTVQPTLPGPLSPNYAEWTAHVIAPVAAEAYLRTPDVEGSRSSLRTRLKVVSS